MWSWQRQKHHGLARFQLPFEMDRASDTRQKTLAKETLHGGAVSGLTFPPMFIGGGSGLWSGKSH